MDIILSEQKPSALISKYYRSVIHPLISCNWPTADSEKTPLTHWGRVTHICVSKLTIIGSDNGLSPDRCQAIIWTNAGLLLIGPLGTNFSEILIRILKVSSAKRRPFCLGLNVLTHWGRLTHMSQWTWSSLVQVVAWCIVYYILGNGLQLNWTPPPKKKKCAQKFWQNSDNFSKASMC